MGKGQTIRIEDTTKKDNGDERFALPCIPGCDVD